MRDPFYFLQKTTEPPGCNAGKLTEWVRVEMTNTGVPAMHIFPASLEQVGKYITGTK